MGRADSRKRSHNKRLAKGAAKRQLERMERQRRKRFAGIAVGVVIVFGLAFIGGLFLFGGSEEPSAQARNTPSATATPEPGRQTGTVQPEPGPNTVACGASAPASADEPKPQFDSPGDMKIDPAKTYTATIETSCGTIEVELDPKTAPQTVNSFVFLADQGYFDGTRIHRIDTSIDVLQGGDPTGAGTGGPGYTIPDELTGSESYPPGTLAMANAGPNTGGSQFFLIAGPDGHGLDDQPNYTVFGHVVKGLDVAEQMLRLPISDPKAPPTDISAQEPQDAIYLESVTVDATKAKGTGGGGSGDGNGSGGG
jgi:cyclophilin family peptidyl-prolyl cis-trans isomerase